MYPVVGVEAFVVYFAVWGSFELAIRSDYKKQVACGHCGFDATWYKRDVKVARQKVAEFWAQKNAANPSVSETVAKQS